MAINEIKKTPSGSKICVICHKEVTGNALKVKDDFIINSIRGVKRLFRIAQNNKLFVCDKDINVHKEKRKKFEKELLIISAIVVIIILLLNGLPLLSGRLQFSMLLSSLFIAILIILFAIVFKYAPAVEETKDLISSRVNTSKVIGGIKGQEEKHKRPLQKIKKGGS